MDIKKHILKDAFRENAKQKTIKQQQKTNHDFNVIL